jgi:hypothetical protein
MIGVAMQDPFRDNCLGMKVKLLLAFDGSPSALRAAELIAGHGGTGAKLEKVLLNAPGPAAPAILAEARRRKPEAIVMGTRGEGALQGFALGSVALKAAVASPVPALLVP